jgi:hypothetical protein
MEEFGVRHALLAVKLNGFKEDIFGERLEEN